MPFVEVNIQAMKNIRHITVAAKNYYWSLEGNEIYSSSRKIIIGLEGTSYSRLYIDPYKHDFEIGPKSVASGILAAVSMGWDPESNSGDMHITSSDGVSYELESSNQVQTPH